MDWLAGLWTDLYKNKEWLFSGVGVAIAAGLITYLFGKQSSSPPEQETNAKPRPLTGADLDAAKGLTHILFVDDDTAFGVVRILKNAGWIHTKIVKDLKSLDDDDVQRTDIFFVDIQGVGKALQFNDQGLGLAGALKRKYPNKRVVIYSADTIGERFHDALRAADDHLPKTAEPYEFQKIVEGFVQRR